MRDDTANLILGCRCAGKCCCPEKPAPTPRTSGLFQQQARTLAPPRLPDESPFIPVIQSYDSPQRPGGWGANSPHLPVAAPVEGAPADFLESAWTGPGFSRFRAAAFGDDGRRLGLPTATPFAVDHGLRRLSWREERTAQVPGRQLEGGWWLLDLRERAADQAQFPQEFDRRLGSPQRGDPPRAALSVTRPRVTGEGGAIRRIGQQLWVGYDGTTGESQAVSTAAGGQVWSATCEVITREWPTSESAAVDTAWPVAAWQMLVRWEARGYNNATLIGAHVTRELQAGYRPRGPGSPLAWLVVDAAQRAYLPGEPLPPDAPGSSPADFPPEGSLTRRDLQGVFDQTYAAPPPLPPPDELRWSSPDGAVTVRGPPTEDHADLADAALLAYGHTLTGGSWAALRDLPLLREDGSVDFGRTLILHAGADTVTLVREGGEAQTCSRADFEDGVLLAPLDRLGPVGPLHNTWPPAWALADSAGETRAVAAWEPWRDLDRQTWPGRPRRRGAAQPPPALRPPLGVTLADVLGSVREDEQLPRAAAPFLLPVRVEVWRDGRWVVSAPALAALAKRTLHAPAAWPEELDDRTSVRGRLRVTFDTPPLFWRDGRTQPVMLLRLRSRRGPPPALDIGGQAVRLLPLGRAAGERGWQPYAAPLSDAFPSAAVPLTYELSSPAALSRALLGYTPTVQRTEV